MANNVDPDQTAPGGSGSVLFTFPPTKTFLNKFLPEKIWNTVIYVSIGMGKNN